MIRGLNPQFKILGDEDELAVIAEEDGQQFISVIEDPKVLNLTYTDTSPIEVNPDCRGSFVKSRRAEVTLEITGLLKETVSGGNAEKHIPDVAEEMSVEQLLAAVNKRLEER